MKACPYKMKCVEKITQITYKYKFYIDYRHFKQHN